MGLGAFLLGMDRVFLRFGAKRLVSLGKKPGVSAGPPNSRAPLNTISCLPLPMVSVVSYSMAANQC